jgi:hypothetical protein
MESPFNEIEPRTAGGNTVHGELRLALEPAQHRGMFMGRVVVPDQVQRPGRRTVLIEQREGTAAILDGEADADMSRSACS